MLQRMIFERIEQRIVVGTIAFLAIMVLIGWLAINEGGRMQAFDRQFTARAIERGASLFNANCSTCHGVDGRGVVGRGPALNTPYLFGHDFLAPVDSQITTLTGSGDTAALCDPMTEEGAAAAAAHPELGDLCTQRASLISTMQPVIDRGYDPDRPSRLANLGWGGGLNSYIYTTLVHGRPVSSYYWPQPMAAWGQTAGGPLRSDQLQDLTQYIMNWDKGNNWTTEDLLAVVQWPINPVDPSTVVAVAGDPRIGSETPLEEVMVGLADLTGDPQAGQVLYNGALACAGCHINEAVAPLTEGTWTRTVEVRLAEPQFAGYTGEMYLAESIVHPNDYIVPGYPAGVMPQNFGDRLSYQELADLIAYLKTYDGPID
jgi:mono/diheme cytochrome c family protein